MKVYFLQRFLSYFIDTILISFIAALFTFFIPTTMAYKESVDGIKTISQQYLDGEITEDLYLESYSKYNYTVQKDSAVIVVIQQLVTVAYFGTYAYYNNGKTVGKKLMKCRVVDEKGNNASHFSLITRTVLIHGVVFSCFSLLFLLFMNANQYFQATNIINSIQSVFLISSVFMIMFRKDGKGLHDFISKTKVIGEK